MTVDSRKPRVLVLTSTFPRWQGDHEPPFVYELARRLTGRFEVKVLAPHAPGSRHHERWDGITVQRFRYAPTGLEQLAYDGGIPAKLRAKPARWWLVPVFLFAQLLATARLIRRFKPDIVHAHWLIPQGLVVALLKSVLWTRARILLTAHGADLFTFNGLPGRSIKDFAIRRADYISVVSREMKSCLIDQGVPDEAVTVAPMGVDLRGSFRPADRTATQPVLVFVGRLVAKKGVADLLSAMPDVVAGCPDARLLIVGDGPLRHALETLASKLELNHSVEFLGKVTNENIPAIYHQARIAVLPFRISDDGDQEGLGLVAVEAMGCGLPVVVGDVPAIKDVITHEQTGWVVPSDSPAALADAIKLLLNQPALARKIGRAARQHAVDNFDWSVAAERYARILSNLMR